MESIKWIDVPNYEGIYKISNLGQIKSLGRYVKSGNGYKTKDRILKQSINKKGYSYIVLCKNSKNKSYSVHSLMAISFLNHIPDGTHKIIVDHIDNNSLNNKLENLQLISQRENCSKDKVGKSSKYTGVCWDKQMKKWKVNIYINGKLFFLGLFSNELDASNCYQENLKYFNDNGELPISNKRDTLSKTKAIRISETQHKTLQKMKEYNVDVGQFIRNAIAEKIKKEHSELIPKVKKVICPFLLLIISSCGHRATEIRKVSIRSDSLIIENERNLTSNLLLNDIGSIIPFDASKPMQINGNWYYNASISYDKSRFENFQIIDKVKKVEVKKQEQIKEKITDKTDNTILYLGLLFIVCLFMYLWFKLKR